PRTRVCPAGGAAGSSAGRPAGCADRDLSTRQPPSRYRQRPEGTARCDATRRGVLRRQPDHFPEHLEARGRSAGAHAGHHRESRMLTLRPYQQDAVAAVYAHLRDRDDNPCVVIPTGGGKTPVMATICKDSVLHWNGRVLIVAHVKELLE